MADWNLRSTRREWDDWLGIFLGILIALAPWIVEEDGNSSVVANAAVAGIRDRGVWRQPRETIRGLCGRF